MIQVYIIIHYIALSMKIQSTLATVQTLVQKPVYHISELSAVVGSRATAYRTINTLKKIGFANSVNRGYLTLRSSVFQPLRLWPYLLPSLAALKQARYFGRTYDEKDVRYVKNTVRGFETLDYRAYELTHFQTPHTLFLYVQNIHEVAKRLKSFRFSEGKRGRVAILPANAEVNNSTQRIYLDCLAFGGRSVLDAIAIELLRGNELQTKGEFPTELIDKVKEDLLK